MYSLEVTADNIDFVSSQFNLDPQAYSIVDSNTHLHILYHEEGDHFHIDAYKADIHTDEGDLTLLRNETNVSSKYLLQKSGMNYVQDNMVCGAYFSSEKLLLQNDSFDTIDEHPYEKKDSFMLKDLVGKDISYFFHLDDETELNQYEKVKLSFLEKLTLFAHLMYDEPEYAVLELGEIMSQIGSGMCLGALVPGMWDYSGLLAIAGTLSSVRQVVSPTMSIIANSAIGGWIDKILHSEEPLDGLKTLTKYNGYLAGVSAGAYTLAQPEPMQAMEASIPNVLDYLHNAIPAGAENVGEYIAGATQKLLETLPEGAAEYINIEALEAFKDAAPQYLESMFTPEAVEAILDPGAVSSVVNPEVAMYGLFGLTVACFTAQMNLEVKSRFAIRDELIRKNDDLEDKPYAEHFYQIMGAEGAVERGIYLGAYMGSVAASAANPLLKFPLAIGGGLLWAGGKLAWATYHKNPDLEVDIEAHTIVEGDHRIVTDTGWEFSFDSDNYKVKRKDDHTFAVSVKEGSVHGTYLESEEDLTIDHKKTFIGRMPRFTQKVLRGSKEKWDIKAEAPVHIDRYDRFLNVDVESQGNEIDILLTREE